VGLFSFTIILAVPFIKETCVLLEGRKTKYNKNFHNPLTISKPLVKPKFAHRLYSKNPTV